MLYINDMERTEKTTKSNTKPSKCHKNMVLTGITSSKTLTKMEIEMVKFCKGKYKKSGLVREQKISCVINSKSWLEKWEDYECVKCGSVVGYNINEVESYKARNLFKCMEKKSK